MAILINDSIHKLWMEKYRCISIFCVYRLHRCWFQQQWVSHVAFGDDPKSLWQLLRFFRVCSLQCHNFHLIGLRMGLSSILQSLQLNDISPRYHPLDLRYSHEENIYIYSKIWGILSLCLAQFLKRTNPTELSKSPRPNYISLLQHHLSDVFITAGEHR